MEMGETLGSVAAKVTELRKSLGERFEQIDQQFAQVYQRFEQVDQRFEQVDQRFERVDERFDTLANEIRTEGERTRRHFNVVVEQIKAERNLVLDLWPRPEISTGSNSPIRLTT
jgi:DNA anti-recombination protein RmuC